MMRDWLQKYRSLSFEQRTMFHARFSILFNLILAGIKLILGFVINAVFFVTAVVNLFMLLSRWECLQGATKPQRRTFKFRNNCVGIFLILAGVQYTIYMIFLLFERFEARTYPQYLGILIALVSFVELGVAIKGCFNAYGKGHYYRNIKVTNLCSAFTAIALTTIAITSFVSQPNEVKNLNGWVGITVGVIIILNGIYVFIAPRISIADRKHNVYKIEENSDLLCETKIKIKLTNSKFYGNYYYIGRNKNKVIEGIVAKDKNPFFQFSLIKKILFLLFSEILLIPYAIGAFIFHIKNSKLIVKLDSIMEQHNCLKLHQKEKYYD